MRFLILFFMAGVSGAALAGPGSAPELGFDDYLQQPQIIIRPAASGQVQEYRMGGQLYMVKITPTKGRSYYLVDSDGDGRLETRRSELDSQFVIPHWTLKRWR